MRRGVTLVEIIVTLVVASILSVGMFGAIKTVAVQSQKAKRLSVHSLDTQTALDQIAGLFYHRVPGSAIGYNHATDTFYPIENLGGDVKTLEWLGTFHEAVKEELVSGFVDMEASVNPVLYSPDTNATTLMTRLEEKWGAGSEAALVFSGTFDQGVLGQRFGWHGGASDDILGFAPHAEGFELDVNATEYIYEKYYLVDTAYAVTRLEDVADPTVTCIQDLHVRDANNTLVLFYNFRPWRGETFCADDEGTPAGEATILAEEIVNFRVDTANGYIRLSIEANEALRGTTSRVRVSKQKVVF